MNNGSRITAIIPAYNASKAIDAAIESVLAQTYPAWEILVVDDGSTDDTADCVSRYSHPVRLFKQANAGPAAARNRGAKEAAGDWFAFLDADDIWLPEKLARQIAYAADPQVGIVCGRKRAAPGVTEVEFLSFDVLWQKNRIGNSTVMIRREAFEQVGGFDEGRDLISVEDYNLWLRLAATEWKILLGPELLMRYAPGHLSAQTMRFALAELANVERIGRLLALPPARQAEKRAAICRQYGRDLFYHREVAPARELLGRALRERPSLPHLGWWLATYLPLRLLDLRRKLASGSASPAGS